MGRLDNATTRNANATSLGLPAHLRFPISSNNNNSNKNRRSSTTSTASTSTSTSGTGNLRVSTTTATANNSSSSFQHNGDDNHNTNNKQQNQYHHYNQFPYQFNHPSSTTPTTVSSTASTFSSSRTPSTSTSATPTSAEFIHSHYAALAAQHGSASATSSAIPAPSSQSLARYRNDPLSQPQPHHGAYHHSGTPSLSKGGGATVLGRENNATARDPMSSLFLDTEPQPLPSVSFAASPCASASSVPFPPYSHNNWMHLQPPISSSQQQQQHSSSFSGHYGKSKDKGTSLAFSVRNENENESDNDHSKKAKKDKEEPSATSDLQGKNSKRTTSWYALAVLMAAISIAVVVGVPVGLSQHKSKSQDAAGNSSSSSSTTGTSSSTNTSTTLAPWTLYPPVDQVFSSQPLPASTRTAIESQDNSLPQVLAYQWLTQDPNLERYSSPQLQQRLALATIYFATKGDSWFGEDITSHTIDDDIHQDGSITSKAEEVPEIVNAIDTNFEDSIVHWLDYQRHECEWYNLAEYQGFSVCYNFTPSDHQAVDPWERHYDYQSLVLSIDPFFVPPPNATLPNPIITPIVQGKLPAEIALLTSLERLELHHQKLKGQLPTELGLLSNSLYYLKLNNNYWSGTIPPDLYRFPRQLWLSHNDRLAPSSIPTTVGLNTHLTSLYMIESHLTGTIPTELMMATKLQQLLIGNNRLEGRLPTEIGRLRSSLQQLNVVDNLLTGRLPSELGRLEKVEYILFDANRFTGTLPRTLGMLRNLNRLEGQSNHLGGSIPPELFATTWVVQTSETANDPNATPKILEATWPHLTTFILQANKLEGPIPTEIGLLQSIRAIQLSYNRLSGPIPSEVGSLTTLRSMNLFNNRLSGTVPTEIGLLGTEAGSLTSLDLGDNAGLNGTVPITLCDGTVSVLWSNNLECPSVSSSSSSSSAMLSPTTNTEDGEEDEDKDDNDDMEDEDPDDEDDD